MLSRKYIILRYICQPYLYYYFNITFSFFQYIFQDYSKKSVFLSEFTDIYVIHKMIAFLAAAEQQYYIPMHIGKIPLQDEVEFIVRLISALSSREWNLTLHFIQRKNPCRNFGCRNFSNKSKKKLDNYPGYRL